MHPSGAVRRHGWMAALRGFAVRRPYGADRLRHACCAPRRTGHGRLCPIYGQRRKGAAPPRRDVARGRHDGGRFQDAEVVGREWPGWSVEHEGEDDKTLRPSADNARKRALLDGLNHVKAEVAK